MANRVCNRRVDIGRELWFMCTQVAASRDVLPGRQDLPKSATAPQQKHKHLTAFRDPSKSVECGSVDSDRAILAHNTSRN